MKYQAKMTHQEREQRRERIIKRIRSGESPISVTDEGVGLAYIKQLAGEALVGQPRKLNAAITPRRHRLIEILGKIKSGATVENIMETHAVSKSYLLDAIRQARKSGLL